MQGKVTKEKGTFLTFIKSFNKFELIWLASVVVLLAVAMIFLPDLMFDDSTNTLIVVCSVVSIVANPICELMISKQSRYNFLFSIAFIEITEMIIYFNHQTKQILTYSHVTPPYCYISVYALSASASSFLRS